MNPRGLLAAAIALAIAGGLVWWSSSTKKDDAKSSATDAAKTILQLNSADLRKIELRRRDAEVTVLESADGTTWKLTSPAPYLTDKDTVSTLVTNLASLNAEEVVEEKNANFATYGLTNPSLTIVATLKDGKSKKVLVGDDAPVGGGSYTRLDGDPRLLILASFNKTSLDKFAADLRDRRLLTVNFEKLVSVAIQSPKGAVEFSRNATGDWQLIKPAPVRTDGLAVEEILRKLREAKLDATLTSDEMKDVATTFPAATLVASASLTDSTSTQTIEIRKKDTKFYARSSAVEGIWVVQGEPMEGFDKTAADYRTKKLFDFGFTEPARVEFRGPEKSITLTKSGAAWSSGGKAMDSVGVQSLIDRLRDLSATGFPTVPAPAPTIEIVVVSSEGKRTEKLLLAKSADTWLARRDGEPAVYQLDAKGVEELQKTAADIKEAPAAPAPAKK